MTANMENGSGLTSEMNVTPLIDVLLVLLIIFMVIVPVVSRGEAAVVPQAARASGSSDAVVLEVSQDTANAVSFRINQQPVAQGELQTRLAAIYANRARRVLLVKGDDGLSFKQIAEVIDIGHNAGIDQIGLITPGIVAAR